MSSRDNKQALFIEHAVRALKYYFVPNKWQFYIAISIAVTMIFQYYFMAIQHNLDIELQKVKYTQEENLVKETYSQNIKLMEEERKLEVKLAEEKNAQKHKQEKEHNSQVRQLAEKERNLKIKLAREANAQAYKLEKERAIQVRQLAKKERLFALKLAKETNVQVSQLTISLKSFIKNNNISQANLFNNQMNAFQKKHLQTTEHVEKIITSTIKHLNKEIQKNESLNTNLRLRLTNIEKLLENLIQEQKEISSIAIQKDIKLDKIQPEEVDKL